MNSISDWVTALHGVARPNMVTFAGVGGTWYPHIPGAPMPCDGERTINVVLNYYPPRAAGGFRLGRYFSWGPFPDGPQNEIIGWRYAE